MTLVNQSLNFASLSPAKGQICSVVLIQIASIMFLYLPIPINSQSFTLFSLKTTLATLEVSLKEKVSIIASLKFQDLQLWLVTYKILMAKKNLLIRYFVYNW